MKRKSPLETGRFIWAAAALGIALFAAPALAQDSTFATAEGPSLTWSLLRSLGALLIILALFFLFIWALRRFWPKSFGSLPADPRKGPTIDVVSVRTLAPRRYVYHLRVEGRDYLVGSTEQTFALLGSWETGERTEEGGGESNPDAASRGEPS